MEIFVSKDGKQAGPFPVEEVQRMIAGGEYSINDLGWREGLKDLIK